MMQLLCPEIDVRVFLCQRIKGNPVIDERDGDLRGILRHVKTQGRISPARFVCVTDDIDENLFHGDRDLPLVL